MPDPQNYNTRLRTNSLILPPRRLRPSPSPPPRQRPAKARSTPPQPLFPPAHVVLHPDDATNKTLLAVGRALLAIDNRAITIKDLSHLSLDYGLLCQNASAASQAITTFIRNHLSRCHQDRSQPLLLSLALTGTAADDRLAPALHSRSGGTSAVKDPERTLTSFRRGTTVWYLSEFAGAPCPFRRAGLSVEDIIHSPRPPPTGTKRKRDARHTLPRKLATPGPAMATRHRSQPVADPATTSRLRVKLTLTRKSPPSDSDRASLSSDPHDLPTDDSRSSSDPESSIPADDDSDSSPVSSQELPPYPILSPSIPSPSCTTPSTALASPSGPCPDPFAPYRHFIKSSFTSFRTALSNPPPDHRARSSSLPFSAASPPPDSEDEDEDYHNSMVGLRRGSVPPPALKKEEQEEDDPIYSMLEPVLPKYVPGSVHVPTRAWSLARLAPIKQEHSDDDVSTPLEVLPGFVSFAPVSDHPPVKDEPTSAVLPPDDHFAIKPEPDHEAVFDPADERRRHDGTRDDPVHIVDDVEVLGPESVISREWDAAWTSDAMDVDTAVARSCTPLLDSDVFERRDEADACASPSETLATAPTSISSPPSEGPAAMDSDHDTSMLLHSLRPCDPPIVATVLEGLPIYHTLLAPGLSFLRRIDTSFVNLTPLMAMLGLPLSTLVSYTHATPRMTVSRAPEPIGGTWVPLAVAQAVARHAGAGKLPSAILDVFLSADLEKWFPDPLARLVQVHGNAATTAVTRSECVPVAVREVGIRVEDVFVGAECVDFKHDARVVELQPSPMRPSCASVVSRGSSFFFDQPRSACASMPNPLNEQEESLFHSFVDILGTGMSTSSSPLSSPPSSPLVKAAVTGAVGVMTSSTSKKENAVAAAEGENAPPVVSSAPAVRRKREKAAVPEMPVRRSKRTMAKVSPPITRSRARNSSEGKVVG